MNGEQIKRVRLMRGLTQAQLAERMGVSRVLIWFIEDNQARLTPDNECRLRAVLAWTPEVDKALEALEETA